MEASEECPPDSAHQEVNPVFLQQLRELDIPEEAARQVCIRHLSNTSPELLVHHHKQTGS